MIRNKILLNIIITLMLLFFAFTNNAKANNAVIADHRYTSAANASDYSQCASLIAVYYTTKVLTSSMCRYSCWYTASFLTFGAAAYLTGCLLSCPYIAEAAALLALYGAYEGYSEWAELLKQNSKIVNTVDTEKNPCDEDLSNAQSSDGEDRNWEASGPLANYCYKEEYNHNLEENDDIYNQGNSKIGISYKGNEPVWIEPEDCKTIETEGLDFLGIGADRVYCAWSEGDEVCSEAVFCTSLLIGDVMPIYGFVGDPDRLTSEARRSCGTDPYTNNSVDDFIKNERCECFCCDGSKDNANNCDSLPPRSCITYNERYNAHCIKKALPANNPVSPYDPPPTISAHCSLDVNYGYSEFSFVGKAVRCFEKTMSNIYHGREDVYEYDIEGNKILDLYGNPSFTNQCIDGYKTDEVCDKAMYKKIQDNLENFVAIILTFWAFFLGVQFLMGKIPSIGEFALHIFKLGIVIYFVQGNAWKDGYYNLLLNSAYTLSSDFFKVTAENNTGDMFANINSIDMIFEGDSNTPSCSNSYINTSGSGSSLWDSLQQCNFFDGVNSYGNLYDDDEKHLAVLDTIDCKFAKYIGMDKNGVFPHIITVAISILFNMPSGFLFFICAMIFLVLVIVILFKIVFFLIVAVIMINFLIFVSPVIIPLVMLNKTKGIFDKWFSELLGYSLQPFLILVLLSLFIALLDNFYLQYLGNIYELVDGIETRNVALGISIPKLSTPLDNSVTISNMLKFLFLLVIIKEVFEKFSSVLENLSGASSVSNFIKSPDVDGAVKWAGQKAGKKASYAGKYLQAKARNRISGARSMIGKASAALGNSSSKKSDDKG